MSKAAEQYEEEAQEEEDEAPAPVAVPDSVWAEYVGQEVCLQLNQPYFAVTSPGVFARLPDGSFIQLPLLMGQFGLKTDARGNVRITMIMKDPDENNHTLVRADLDPKMVAVVSVAQQRSRIQL
jgi:hypothetical protein